MTNLTDEAHFDQSIKRGLESFQDDSNWELAALEEVLDTADMLAPASGFWPRWGLGLLPPGILLLVCLSWLAIPRQAAIHYSISDDVSYAVSENPQGKYSDLNREGGLEPLVIQLQVAEVDKSEPLPQSASEPGKHLTTPETPVEISRVNNQAVQRKLDTGIISRLEPIHIEQNLWEGTQESARGNLVGITPIPIPVFPKRKPGNLGKRRKPTAGFTVPGKTRMRIPASRSSQLGRSPGRSHGMGGRSRGR